MSESAASKTTCNYASRNNNEQEKDEDQAYVYALQISHSFSLSITLTVALDLGFFNIISRAGPGAQLSASEIVSHVRTRNPRAALVVDRMLNLLATHSLLTSKSRNTMDDFDERVYGLAAAGKHFVTNAENDVACGPYQRQGPFMEKWLYMTDAVLEDIIPFEKASGMSLFEFTNKDPKFNFMFNKAMAESTRTTMNNILATYQGFENVKVLVDVGGGLGTSLELVLSKYPHIKGINFDLPHVIKEAPHIPGVEHVGGDIFQCIPTGDAILMKSILHDFDDKQCTKLLKNCYKALSEKGKVVLVTTILPEAGCSSIEAKFVAELDINMLSHLPGRERTQREFKALAEASGFHYSFAVYGAHADWVIELHK